MLQYFYAQAKFFSSWCEGVIPQTGIRQKWDSRFGDVGEHLLAIAEEVNQSRVGLVRYWVDQYRVPDPKVVDKMECSGSKVEKLLFLETNSKEEAENLADPCEEISGIEPGIIRL